MARTVIPTLSDTSVLRLFCFPYAGGGAAVYHRWRAAVPDWLELVPMTLPGHDGRLHERPRTELRPLVGSLADALQAALDRPYALLGYSIGAWLAYELARELRRRPTASGPHSPALLVVAASRAPHARSSDSPLHRLPDVELVATVDRRYGGIPAAVRDSPELLELLLPVLRADLQLAETYEHAEEPPLDVPIFALGGTEDRAVSAAELGEWRHHTTGDCTVRLFPGGHFFLFDGGREGSEIAPSRTSEISPALRAILARLQRCLPPHSPKPRSADEGPAG